MHVDPICTYIYIHTYNLKILIKVSAVVNDYTFVPINYVYNKNNLNNLNVAINDYISIIISHVMRWATMKTIM